MLNLSLSDSSSKQLIEFLYFLQKWNQSYNLTAITELKTMVSHHLLDSLAIAPYIDGKLILDLGTGPGFPGIPLACVYPQKYFLLLDSNGKKIRFLNQAKAQFHFSNIEVVQERVESFQYPLLFDNIICRAVGDSSRIIKQSRHLCAANGRWLLMKGLYPSEELELLSEYQVTVMPLKIPGIDAQRHLVIVENQK